MTPTPTQRRNAYLRTSWILIRLLFNSITAPVVYCVWWVFREKICEKVYISTTAPSFEDNWKYIEQCVRDNDIRWVKWFVKLRGGLIYWLWTYGDLHDPLGRGGMPEAYGRNTFWNRFRWSAIRNPRFTWHYLELRTGTITHEYTVLDTRTEAEIYSNGIGHMKIGKIFKWFYDGDRWYYIFEYANSRFLFYIGYVGGVKFNPIGRDLRFEVSLRKVSKEELY